MIDYYEARLNLIFTGCGYLGVISVLEQIWPHKPFHKVSGASSGGLFAVLFACGVSLDKMCKAGSEIAERTWEIFKNPFGKKNVTMVTEQILEKLLPEDSHLRCSNRLLLSITKLWSFKTEYVSEFKSRDELKAVVLATCFLPILSGFSSIKINKNKYIDGGLSDNRPTFKITEDDIKHQVIEATVGPFDGKHEVRPISSSDNKMIDFKLAGLDYSVNWYNIYRFTQALIPPPLDKQKQTLIDGHLAMKSFLIRKNLIKCRICYNKHKFNDTSIKMKPCIYCLKLLEQVDSLQAPNELLKLFDKHNK